ncbi:hypothetical protein ZIOFF_057915 [Zingiber officinale]|uniref:C3H1-type domain-containing protein n=1 Tax=Zingiber officinale TaxID=94328 RepID=A0A8J5F874_ZINOF|nr:hypothetical protein ZIOFF_057915 [Zingiber officinale]
MEDTPSKKRRVSDAPPPSFYKTRLPSFSMEPPLPKKRRVSDVHPPSFYKARLCLEFISTGCCPYGDACINAHGRDDGFRCSKNSGRFGAVAMEHWQDSTLRVEGN